MQFDQVIVILLSQGVDSSKTSKSFHDGADLLVVVCKLVGISELALAIEDKVCPSRSLEMNRKMVQLRRSKPKDNVR